MQDEPTTSDAITVKGLRIVAADDDTFTTALIGDALRSHGFEVKTASSIDSAWELIESWDPHAIVSDLNFGPGESGASLLKRAGEFYPWMGLVVLTSHLTPELAVADAQTLPTGAVYLVKTQLASVNELVAAVRSSISGEPHERVSAPPTGHVFFVTRSQAELLRLIASGATTRMLAEKRGSSIRAAETMTNRMYTALGLENDDQTNLRVAAIRLWQQGRVTVR
jgi:DNA-binding NarL/FixJ family response regulator